MQTITIPLVIMPFMGALVMVTLVVTEDVVALTIESTS